MLAALCLLSIATVQSGQITLNDGSKLTVFFTDRKHRRSWRPDGAPIAVNKVLVEQLSADDQSHPGLFEVDSVLEPTKALQEAPLVMVSLTKGPRAGISSSATRSTVVSKKQIWMSKGQEFQEVPTPQDVKVEVAMPAKQVDSWLSFGRRRDGIVQLHSGGKPLRLQVSGVDHPKVIGPPTYMSGPVTVVTVPDFGFAKDWSWDLVVFNIKGKRLQLQSIGPHNLSGIAVRHLTDYYFSGNVRSVARVEIWKRKKESHILRDVHFSPSALTK